MRACLFLVFSLVWIAGAQAQSFDPYTVGPYTGCCNGPGFTGSPQPTDTVAITRVGPGNVPITATLPLGSFASAADLQTANARIDQGFAQLRQSITQVERGVAATVAMASTFMPSAPGRTAWAVNAATFQGEVGAGFSLAHRLNLSVPVAITAGYGNGGGSAHVGRVGLMGEF
jgi:trimeric autotransporter adhesin